MKKLLLIISIFAISSLKADDILLEWGPPPTEFLGGPFDAFQWRAAAGTRLQPPFFYYAD